MTKHSRVLVLLLAFSLVFVFSGIVQSQSEEMVVCAVSGKQMKKSEAKGTYEYKGKTYYFCCDGCKEKFIKDPETYLKKKAEMKEVYTCSMHPKVKSDKPGKCPKCGMNLEKKMMHMGEMHKCEEHKGEEHGCMHEKGEEKPCCSMMGMMKADDVEFSVKNVKNGVTIQLTSKNKDAVKKIQEMVAKMKSACEEKEVKKEEVKK